MSQLTESPILSSSSVSPPNPAGSPEPDSRGETTPIATPLGAGLLSLEGNAVQFGIAPVDLPRANCSVDAEGVLRRLGRFPRVDKPWLPITTLGPLLVFAHHAPKTEDMWGVPEPFAVRIAISEEQYAQILKDLVMRLSNSPLPRENSLEGLQAPDLETGDYEEAFNWLLSHYPF